MKILPAHCFPVKDLRWLEEHYASRSWYSSNVKHMWEVLLTVAKHQTKEWQSRSDLNQKVNQSEFLLKKRN